MSTTIHQTKSYLYLPDSNNFERRNEKGETMRDNVPGLFLLFHFSFLNLSRFAGVVYLTTFLPFMM